MKKMISILLAVAFLTGVSFAEFSNGMNGTKVAPKVVTNKTKRFA